MIRAELIQKLMKRSNSLTRPMAQARVDVFFKEIIQALSEGKKVTLRGFGTFNVKMRPDRKARHPQTGQTVHIDSKNVAFFKTSPALLTQLNQGEKR